tara:strand:+ start:901 stop:1020 length:120 start_codon:yes stop_codon:yes gene_type:complete
VVDAAAAHTKERGEEGEQGGRGGGGDAWVRGVLFRNLLG